MNTPQQNNKELKNLGKTLITKYHKSEKTFIQELHKQANKITGTPRLTTKTLFHFVNALLAYAQHPGTEQYYQILPALYHLCNTYPQLKKQWQQTAHAFLANRITGKGNVPTFKIQNKKQYETLKQDISIILNTKINDTKVYEKTLQIIQKKKIPYVYEWIILETML